MARPIDADAEETRRKLVDAALEQFAERGFHGVSNRDLAAAARVNAAVISFYFGGKQGLYDAAVDEVYRRLRDRIMQAALAVEPAAKRRSKSALLLPGPRGPVELDALVESLYHAARAERSGVRLLVRQVLDHGRLTLRTEQRHFLPGTESFTELLASALGVPAGRARLAVIALSYLLSRYVVQDDASLSAALGAPTHAEAHRRVVASLTATARAHLEK
ncbi:MAG TPA: TetR family transcriptional regulator [Polyangia bacterium]|nr:TetR family transcriptional regulator [Polyangia bacterium]